MKIHKTLLSKKGEGGHLLDREGDQEEKEERLERVKSSHLVESVLGSSYQRISPD